MADDFCREIAKVQGKYMVEDKKKKTLIHRSSDIPPHKWMM